MNRVAIVRRGDDAPLPAVREALEWIRWRDLLPQGATLFIKPNFTYPVYKPGVTTSPELIEAVVSVVAERCGRVLIGESDGGAHGWRAEDAFSGHGLDKLVRTYGVELVNLSTLPVETVTTTIGSRRVRVDLPRLLLREVDAFATLPVPKVHVNTGVSLGFKNQWGCIPSVWRLRYHPQFATMILGINQLLRTRLTVFDGTYFLDRTGPMDGEPIRRDLVIASDEPGAGTLACCEIMGIDPQTIRHLRLAQKIGMMPRRIEHLEVNVPLTELRDRPFQLRRSLRNHIVRFAFNSTILTTLLWNSPLAGPLHEGLYFFRGRPKDLTPRW